ncbi:tetratricopeptide repeat protein [Glycomyces harbinensis]|uniref:Tetratricopeptide repeat-containing protein n=1 Tax=Glycomyces harbinensis TaxID=58114 RepID=A0A1G7B3G3_9ACTN|nr:tetratricopeptide repeat protein [Glycomyces harbinensis]SDE21450.1 Tetratricopeptide repeat-containing protein [Glycomyces harbinensis]
MSDDDLIGLHGKETSGPRWKKFRKLNNTAARMAGQGRTAKAIAMFQEAYALTLVPDVDAAGLDARARVLGNLAGMAEGQGDTAGSLRYAEEALQAAAEAEAQAGDRYGTVAVRASILVNRAQTFQLLGRLDDALADLDAAMAITDEGGDDEGYVAISVHNSRSVLLIGLERWEEAEAAARHTLALANARDPRLAGYPYSNLAAIAQGRNDHEAAMAYLRLAEELHEGDPSAVALAVANQGRAAMRAGDVAEGGRLLAKAEQVFADGRQPLRAAEIRYSRAHAAFQSGDADLANELLPESIAVLRSAGHVSMLAEALALQGDLLAARAEYEQTEAAYLEARRCLESLGARYHLARIDMRRAFAVAEQCTLAVTTSERERLLRLALDLSLPSALATDAIRHQFTPGLPREQWAATVAIPAMAHALNLAAALQDGALVSELLEHMSATVSLHAPTANAAYTENPVLTATMPDPLELPATQSELLPFAAAGLVTGASGDFPAPRFALPPRLRVNPGRPSHLEPWIQETERRYGFAIRSDVVVDTW